MSKLSLDAGAEWAGVDAKEELVDLRSRIRVLEAELQGYKESHDTHCPSAERVRSLEAALRTVAEIVFSDSVEYDDLRNAQHVIDSVLPSHSETKAEPRCVCSSRASQIRVGESHMPDCPRYEPNRSEAKP
jgi:hypothetical protein